MNKYAEQLWVERVINSCETLKQVTLAESVIKLYEYKHKVISLELRKEVHDKRNKLILRNIHEDRIVSFERKITEEFKDDGTEHF